MFRKHLLIISIILFSFILCGVQAETRTLHTIERILSKSQTNVEDSNESQIKSIQNSLPENHNNSVDSRVNETVSASKIMKILLI